MEEKEAAAHLAPHVLLVVKPQGIRLSITHTTSAHLALLLTPAQKSHRHRNAQDSVKYHFLPSLTKQEFDCQPKN